jgi:acetyl esterase/lipase
MGHPLVSPALGYLGGLPPLFVVASDKEVLRDEIIFMSVSSRLAKPCLDSDVLVRTTLL